MTTEAENAAGRALYLQEQDLIPVDWDSVGEADQAAWITCAMAIVRAYQRATWREPTEEDIHERKPMLMTVERLAQILASHIPPVAAFRDAIAAGMTMADIKLAIDLAIAIIDEREKAK